jgi:hypothetical protein
MVRLWQTDYPENKLNLKSTDVRVATACKWAELAPSHFPEDSTEHSNGWKKLKSKIVSSKTKLNSMV